MPEQLMREVMSTPPSSVAATDPIATAARLMAAEGVGDVLVLRDGDLAGILTDRDIAVRAVARQLDTEQASVDQICSRNPMTVSADAPIPDAVALMRDHAVRRLPVVDGGRPVGIVSIGDLAQQRDPESALATISRAPANQ